MVDFAPMNKLLAYWLAAAALLVPSRVWAGPSGSGMMSDGVAASSSTTKVAAPVTFESLAAPVTLDRERVDDLFADADEMTPTDPHPMIPLPPAVWAGFAGLAFVTKRVLRQKPFVAR